jgi:hypothetical protein
MRTCMTHYSFKLVIITVRNKKNIFQNGGKLVYVETFQGIIRGNMN